ncbi:helix-turn-helix domain-containing protein [Lactococcus taiwanensis]|uniref:helix-turn-helix domain-containing protein n=1 Tax=Lactococcus taiwanensis TaxID=1151742 RepID=UPI00190388FD|nr:helix-turn-helix domain-containing protein [Lactococcus taiwanensis]
MELEKIKKLYENVDPNQLTAREKLLTALLFTDDVVSTDKLPNGRYRMLQFSSNDFLELESTLKLLLPDFVKSNAQEQYVIEAFSTDSPTKSELFDIFQTLAQDRGEEVSLYIGRFVDKNKLSATYSIEREIFQSHKGFSEYILSESLTHFDFPMLEEIRQELLANGDDQTLVRTLYKTGGNQTQAAKALYIHRNTLINKVKKYEQKYGLQLTGSDLVLAFNLL